jgi:hypothetical protein
MQQAIAMSPTTTRAAPWRPLAILTAGVVLLHLVLLQSAPLSLRFEEPEVTRTFITRTVVFQPPAPKVAEPVRTAAPAPAPRPAPPQRTPREPTPVASAATAPVTPPPTIAQGADSSTQAASPVPALPTEPPAKTEPAPPTVIAPPAAPDAQPASTAAYAIPGSTRLQYVVTGQQGTQPLQGVQAEFLWLQDGQQYQAKLDFRFLFRSLRSQTSTGRITPDGLAPERFTDKRRTEVATHFQRDKGKISFSANTTEVPLLSGAQDRLSLFLQLASLIAGNPAAYPAGTVLNIQTAGPRDADTWALVVGEPETLKLPIGETVAMKIVRTPRRDYDQKVEVWLAPSLGYLPVRVRLTEADGDMADQQLRATSSP